MLSELIEAIVLSWIQMLLSVVQFLIDDEVDEVVMVLPQSEKMVEVDDEALVDATE